VGSSSNTISMSWVGHVAQNIFARKSEEVIGVYRWIILKWILKT
jgi:hypothetical protein